ncbi:hypothetical protein HK104_003182 [Borealophlyctis nickersoniae]|nr:hypothetical protein HK104_003182 [Borealophlyctis nickersoniae]
MAQAYASKYLSARSFPEKDALLKELLAEENDFRKVFAQNPNDAKIRDPYVSLVPVHENEEIWKAKARTPEEEKIPVLMAVDEEKRAKEGTPMIASKEQFLLNWRMFTEGSLQFLDWSNIFAAGGSILGCLAPVPEDVGTAPGKLREHLRKEYPGSDIDLFIYGLDEEAAKAKMQKIFENYVDSCPYETIAFRTPHAVTIVSQYPFRHVQIVLRLYKSPAEVLMGFDVDCCGVGFDGERVWSTRRAHHAIMSQSNTVDMTRRSPSYEMRLAKYGDRGYEIRVPLIDRTRIDPQIFERSYDKVNGLGRLLVLESIKDPAARMTFKEEQRVRKLRPAHEKAGDYARLDWARSGDLKSSGVDANDYNNVLLAYGPEWPAKRLRKLAHQKDYILNNPFLIHRIRKTRHHQHPTFYGTMSDIMEDCCGQCPPLPEDWDPAEDSVFVRGKLKFVVDNPGRQEIGSFNPITDEDWTADAYVPEGLETLLNAISNNRVETVDDLLTKGKYEVDRRDWVGRTLLQFATFCNAVKTVKFLMDRGARISLTLPDGRTPLHIAAQYGYLEIAKLILERNKLNMAEKEKGEKEKAEKEKAEKETDEKEKAEKEKAAAAGGSNTSETVEDKDGDVQMGEPEGAEEADYESITHDEISEDEDYEKVPENPEKDEDSMEDEPEYDVIDLEFTDWDMKMAPLHYACFHGHTKVVSLLLEFGANGEQLLKCGSGNNLPGNLFHVQSSWYSYKEASYTPLYLATLAPDRSDAKEVISVLLKHGVAIGQELSSRAPGRVGSNEGQTIFHRIALEGRIEFLDTLCAKGVKGLKSALDLLTNEFESAVGIAAKKGQFLCLSKLLKAGAKAEYSLAACKNLIERSMRRGFTGRAYLINHRYNNDPKIMQKKLSSPLALAIEEGNHQCAKALIEAGANFNAVDTDSCKSILDIVLGRIKSCEEAARDDEKSRVDKEKQKSHKGPEDKWVEKHPGGLDEFLLSSVLRPKKADDEDEDDGYKPSDDHLKALHEWYENLEDDAPPPPPKAMSADFKSGKWAGKSRARTLKRYQLCLELLKEKKAKTFAELNPDYKPVQQSDPSTPSPERPKKPMETNPVFDTFVYRRARIPREDGERYYQLFQACWAGDCARIRSLTTGAELGQQLLVTVENRGITPLMVASYRGHADAVRCIVAIVKEQYKPPTRKSYKDMPNRAVLNNYEIEGDHSEESDEEGSDNEGSDEEEEEEGIDEGMDVEEAKSHHEEEQEEEEALAYVQVSDYPMEFGSININSDNEYAATKSIKKQAKSCVSVEAYMKKEAPIPPWMVLPPEQVGKDVDNINVTALKFAIAKDHVGVVKALLDAAQAVDEEPRPADKKYAHDDLEIPFKLTLVQGQPGYLLGGRVPCPTIDWAFALGSVEMVRLLVVETLGGDPMTGLFETVLDLWRDRKQKMMVESLRAIEESAAAANAGSTVKASTAPKPTHVTQSYEGLKPKSYEVAKEEKKATRSGDSSEKNKFKFDYIAYLEKAALFNRTDIAKWLLNATDMQKVVAEFMERNPTDPRAIFLSKLDSKQREVAIGQMVGTAPLQPENNGCACFHCFNADSYNALHRAAVNSNHEIMKLLLSGLPKDRANEMLREVAGVWGEADMAIHMAVAAGSVECVEALVQGGGVEVLELVDPTKGWTALHYAAYMNRVSVVSAILQLTPPNMLAKLLDISTKDFKQTPLMLAAKQGNHRVTKLLLEAQSNKTLTSCPADFQGVHPLHLAVRGEYIDTVKKLLMAEDVRTVLSTEDAAGFTPLGTAMQRVHLHLRYHQTEELIEPTESDSVKRKYAYNSSDDDEDDEKKGKKRVKPVRVYQAIKAAMTATTTSAPPFSSSASTDAPVVKNSGTEGEGEGEPRHVVPLKVAIEATKVAVKVRGRRESEPAERSKYELN